MDKYNERLIEAKAPGSSIALFAVAILLVVISIPFFFLVPAIGFLIMVGGIFMITYVKDGLSNEYEYIITNGDIEVARVLAKKRRKNLVMIESGQINRLALATDERVANDISIGKYKVKKYVGKNEPNKDEGEYRVAVFTGEGDSQQLFLLDLDAKCIDHLNSVVRSKSEIKL
ncbi:hypothetical protein SAMN02910369_01013 [Lachnospiraceae bacterium NE2001]|nr:hypothetical protein SAMN02910369_01013 [Lachnospiraceae bacterium NE2001]